MREGVLPPAVEVELANGLRLSVSPAPGVLAPDLAGGGRMTLLARLGGADFCALLAA